MFNKLYYRIFKRYRRLEHKLLSYGEADALIRNNAGKPENEQWVIAPEEDNNRFAALIGMVHLERRERILA